LKMIKEVTFKQLRFMIDQSSLKKFVYSNFSYENKNIFFSRDPDIPALNKFRIFITMFKTHLSDNLGQFNPYDNFTRNEGQILLL